jgi:hypothetical protein
MASAVRSTLSSPAARCEAWSEPSPGAEAKPARLEGLPRLLRGVGALALMGAASSFLLQHWENGGDVWRYYALLTHTFGLGLLGFVWGLRADDAKGARTFLALAAGLVPAHFCILGGLVYSQFSWDGPLSAVASYATWVAPGPVSALGAAGASALALGAVTAVAFVALARARAGLLGWVYLVGNALLLVPTRDPSWVAAMVGLHAAALVAVDWRIVRPEPRLRTLEGSFVRAMLFAPPLLMLARSALHYELSPLYYAVTSGALALASFAFAEERRTPLPLRGLLRSLCLASIGVSSASATVALFDALALSMSVALPLAGVLFASLVTGLSLFAGEARWGEAYRRAAALALLGTTAADLLLFPGVVSSIAALCASIATLSYGFVTERRTLFLVGVGGALFAAATHVRAAIELYAVSHWGSLALLGVLVILAATAVERHGVSIGDWLGRQRRRLGEPDETAP